MEGTGWSCKSRVSSDVRARDVGVVFSRPSTESFENYDQSDHADASTSHAATRTDVPL